jgi:hypothetical protein
LTVSVAPNAVTTLTVACPVGKRVFGGGYESNTNAALVHPVATYPPTQDSWRVILQNDQSTAASIQFRVYAVCATSN